MLGLLPPNHEPCFIFRCLFIRQLSPEIKAHLVTATDKTPRELAIFANQLWMTRSSTTNVSAAIVEEPSACLALNTHRTRTTRPPPPPPSICWYHKKFDDKAERYYSLCSFNPGNGTSGGWK